MSFLTLLDKAFGNPYNIGIGREVLSPQPIFKQITYSLEDFRKENLYIPFLNNPGVLPQWEIPDTNSMDSHLDTGAKLTYLQPATPEDHAILCDWLKPGDDVYYRSVGGDIIHRIHEIKNDGRRLFVLGGINRSRLDPYLVRDEHIRAILVRVDY